MSLNTKHTQLSKSCSRCQREFVCNPDDILNCDCHKIHLSLEETQFVASQFNDCICNNCLLELKHHYSLKINPDDKTKSYI